MSSGGNTNTGIVAAAGPVSCSDWPLSLADLGASPSCQPVVVSVNVGVEIFKSRVKNQVCF